VSILAVASVAALCIMTTIAGITALVITVDIVLFAAAFCASFSAILFAFRGVN